MPVEKIIFQDKVREVEVERIVEKKVIVETPVEKVRDDGTAFCLRSMQTDAETDTRIQIQIQIHA